MSLPSPSMFHTIDEGRLRRAAGVDIGPQERLTFAVQGSCPYVVSFQKDGPTCTCPDHVHRGMACKHILAVLTRKLGFDPRELEHLTHNDVVARAAPPSTFMTHE